MCLLRTGWSVKTGSLDSRYGEYTYTSSHPGNSASSTPVVALTDEERSMIIQVIQRAEALDLAEQERVGRLVERLENMKRNVSTAMGSGTTERTCGSRCAGGTKCVCSCALCGERFAVLGAGPGLCKDCRRYICQKCGIEATPAVTSPSASAPASTSTTSQVGEVAQRLLRRRSSTASAQRLFLCRICAETREMWKKSGAWFFKGLPKYILPEKKDRGRPRAGSRASGWTLASSTRRLDSLEQDSSSDDDATRRLGLMRRFSTTVSSGDHSSREDAPTSTTDEKSLHSLAATTPSVAYRRQSSCPTPEMSFLGGDSSSKTSEVPRAQISPSPSSVTVRSRKSPNGVQQVGFPDLDEPVEEQRSSSPQVQLRRLSSGERRSPREANVEPEWNRCRVRAGLGQDKQSRNQAQTASSGLTGPDLGTLEVSLRFDPAAQSLQCKVLRARGLLPMDIQGLADPFCKLNILPVTSNSSRRLRTKTVHKTRDPEFNETVNFYGTTEADTKSSALHVLILQDDPAGHDFLGEARFPLNELQPYQTKAYNVFLENHYPVDQEDVVWGEGTNPRGQLQLTLSYSTRRRALLVTVQSAANLLPMDSNGFSDPFVKLTLMKDPKDTFHRFRSYETASAGSKASKKDNKKQGARNNVHSTSVKWKTLNPEWNEEFAFETRLTDLTGLALTLSVWDKDFGKSNDYLGGLVLSCNSKGARLRHWIDAIKFPDHRHQAWHNLTEAVVPE
ncbi:rabphilin-3A isoform X2 [Orussus abietinus]|uniref:rabphilin-3A isoform X2 n=1 Tax=Orussus abietinus TaxID=222816 RepID=UPI00062559AF|nr:rabphilin-3A isoform X2 [Orussus abietinus]